MKTYKKRLLEHVFYVGETAPERIEGYTKEISQTYESKDRNPSKQMDYKVDTYPLCTIVLRKNENNEWTIVDGVVGPTDNFIDLLKEEILCAWLLQELGIYYFLVNTSYTDSNNPRGIFVPGEDDNEKGILFTWNIYFSEWLNDIGYKDSELKEMVHNAIYFKIYSNKESEDYKTLDNLRKIFYSSAYNHYFEEDKLWFPGISLGYTRQDSWVRDFWTVDDVIRIMVEKNIEPNYYNVNAIKQEVFKDMFLKTMKEYGNKVISNLLSSFNEKEKFTKLDQTS